MTNDPMTNESITNEPTVPSPQKSVILYAEDHFRIVSKQHRSLDTIARQARQRFIPQARGQDQFGYGAKITTEYMVQFASGPGTDGPDEKGDKRWRRVYCTCFSNVASFWVERNGITYHFRNEENLRSSGAVGEAKWGNEPLSLDERSKQMIAWRNSHYQQSIHPNKEYADAMTKKMQDAIEPSVLREPTDIPSLPDALNDID